MINETPKISDLTVQTYIKYRIANNVFIGKIIEEDETSYMVRDIVSFDDNHGIHDRWYLPKQKIGSIYIIMEATDSLKYYQQKYAEYMI